MHSRFRNPAHGWANPEWHAPWWDPELESRRFQRRSSRNFRLYFPVIISFLVTVPSVFFDWARPHGVSLHDWGTPGALLLAATVALVGPLALLFARRFPGPIVVVVGVAASVDLLLANGADGPPYIAFAFAIGSAIVRSARIWAWATIGAS